MTFVIGRDEILQQYGEVKNSILQTCLQFNRPSHEVTLIAVSKFQSIDKIRFLLLAGQRDFAESRIEEVEEKWKELLVEYPDVRLHFVGPIQSRKVKKIVAYVHYIHSVDRLEVAQKIARECAVQKKSLDCLIQINIGNEPQKAGINMAEFPPFLDKCRNEVHISIIGIMCIPPVNQEPIPYFIAMKKLQENHNLRELSMGMSNDYREAIQCGATMVRVGSNIFGSRGQL